MSAKKTCEVGGVTYESRSDKGVVCNGCAAYTQGEIDRPLCHALDSCHDIVWVKQKAQAPVPAAPSTQPAGRKDDSGKLDVTLFFDDLPHAIEGVTQVLQWAITKKQPVPYERGSWQFVEDFQRRYRGAMLRHTLNAAKTGMELDTDGKPFGVTNTFDQETGLLELAHIATDAMFMLEMALRKRKGLPTPEGA
jgi:hypothetical protein